jgi:hypothetical protein
VRFLLLSHLSHFSYLRAQQARLTMFAFTCGAKPFHSLWLTPKLPPSLPSNFSLNAASCSATVIFLTGAASPSCTFASAEAASIGEVGGWVDEAGAEVEGGRGVEALSVCLGEAEDGKVDTERITVVLGKRREVLSRFMLSRCGWLLKARSAAPK